MQIEAILPSMATSAPTEFDERNVVRERAAAVMQVLRELIPWDGYSLSAWDAMSGTHRHETLASEGYAVEVQDHMNDGFVESNPAFGLLHTRVPRSLRWRDLHRDWNIPFAKTFTAEEVLIPAGFMEGTTMCLRLHNGRYTGSLHVSWADERVPNDGVRDTIEGFRPQLADACDLLRVVHASVGQMGPDARAVLVSVEGKVSELPGREPGTALGVGGDLRRLLTQVPALLNRPRFLWADADRGCHRVHVLRCRGQVKLVSERSIPWPFGLSHRETQILQLVALGMSNPQIAPRLHISPRTVSTHIEHILHKLSCQSRAQLAAMAVGAGLLLADEAIESALA